jgi:hypothetical protein
MNSNLMYQLTAVLLLVGSMTLVKCNGSDQKTVHMAADSMRPTSSPDNNSANNPSLADTAYESNRTRPVTDTMKKDGGK